MILWMLACLPDLGARSAAAFEGRCAECHPTQSADHAASRHAASSLGELFVAVRAEASEPKACDACHAPNGPNIGCLDCHAAAGHEGASNGRLLWDWTGPIRGPHGKDGAPHASEADPFLTDAELCGTCHEVDGEGAFDERPLEHWRRSKAAADGVACQDCHMSATPGVAGAAGDHRTMGLQVDALSLLQAGVLMEAYDGGVWLTNRSGHRVPDGAAWTRELWLASDDHELALHPEMLAKGRPTGDPFAANEVVFRGLLVDERRWVAMAPGEVCLWYRPIAQIVAQRWDQPVPAPMLVDCVTVR